MIVGDCSEKGSECRVGLMFLVEMGPIWISGTLKRVIYGFINMPKLFIMQKHTLFVVHVTFETLNCYAVV